MASDLSTLSKGELIKIIYQQSSEIDILRQTIIELQEKMQQKDSDDDAKRLPSFVKLNVKKKKKSERKIRNHGFARKLESPTKRIFHSYDVCPNCHVVYWVNPQLPTADKSLIFQRLIMR